MVPECISPLAITVAVWQIETRTASFKNKNISTTGQGYSQLYLGLLEYEGVRLVVPDEELQVEVDRLLPGQDGGQLVHLVIHTHES